MRNTGPSGTDAAKHSSPRAALWHSVTPDLTVLVCPLIAALKCGMQPMGSQDSWGNWIWGNDKCWGGDMNSNPWNGCWGSSDGGLWDKVR